MCRNWNIQSKCLNYSWCISTSAFRVRDDWKTHCKEIEDKLAALNIPIIQVEKPVVPTTTTTTTTTPPVTTKEEIAIKSDFNCTQCEEPKTEFNFFYKFNTNTK